MTRRSYIEAALRGRRTDRIPCFPLVDVVYASAYANRDMASLQLDPLVHAHALAQCARELPIDGLYINLCLGRNQASQFVCHDRQYKGRIDGGLEVAFAENDVAAVASTDIVSLDDQRISTAELFHPGMLETFQALSKDVRQEVAVFAGLTGAFSQVGFLIGMQNLMIAMIDDREGVHRAVRIRQQAAFRQARELRDAGARFIWIGEGMASSSLLSPTMYTEFVLPYEQALADEIRRLGCLSLLHICGNTTPALAEIAKSRVDGVDVDYLTDWGKAVETLGRNMCIKGNIDPLLFLPGKSVALTDACKAALLKAGESRAFIMSTGCLVPRDATRKAFKIIARTCDGWTI